MSIIKSSTFIIEDDISFLEIDDNQNLMLVMSYFGEQDGFGTDEILGFAYEINNWKETDGNIELIIKANIESSLKHKIYDYTSQITNLTDVEAKPLMETIKKRLINMINMIDEIRYEE